MNILRDELTDVDNPVKNKTKLNTVCVGRFDPKIVFFVCNTNEHYWQQNIHRVQAVLLFFKFKYIIVEIL